MGNLVIVLSLLFLNAPDLLAGAKTVADADPFQEEFRDVASDLRCPTCTGISVLESEASFSVQIKDIVKEKVKAGESRDQILSYFTERYGPWILREPPKTGFNIVAWAFPIALLVLGPIFVYLLVWRKKRVSSAKGVRSSSDIVDEMESRLAEMRGT